jgi:hypothetical protein
MVWVVYLQALTQFTEGAAGLYGLFVLLDSCGGTLLTLSL